MEKQFVVKEIGVVCSDETGCSIRLHPEYQAALKGLEGFSHLQVLWWFSGCDNGACRAQRTEKQPYVDGPEILGSFATRSPQRPNPLALSCCGVTFLDPEAGTVGLDYIDADDQSPVLDLKPYTPSLDRVERPAVPDWCAHWPENVETSGEFDWGSVFTF